MRSLILGLVILCFAAPHAMRLEAQSATHQDLKIFVDLQSSDQTIANIYSAKLISHLAKHGFSVVESVDDADAVLHGGGLVEGYSGNYGRTRYFAQAGMRLVNKDGVVLWADDVRSSRYAESASSSFAENVAKDLDKALSQKATK